MSHRWTTESGGQITDLVLQGSQGFIWGNRNQKDTQRCGLWLVSLSMFLNTEMLTLKPLRAFKLIRTESENSVQSLSDLTQVNSPQHSS
jgi:hypothetical protein